MYLSENFTLEELTINQVRWVTNHTESGHIQNLKRLASSLEEVRTVLKESQMYIISGYRSHVLNSAIGGRPNTAHLEGLAADFISPAFGDPMEVAIAIQESDLEYNRLVYTGKWVHYEIAHNKMIPEKRVLTLVEDGIYANGIVYTGD